MPKSVDLAAALAADVPSEGEALTFDELLDAFFARNPARSGEERLRKWRPAFGHLDAWGISAEALIVAAEAMLAAGYKPGSVNADLNGIGSAYKWARQRRLTPRGFRSPTLDVPRYSEDIRRVHVSDEEMAALRAGSVLSRSRGFGAFVNALCDCGARKGELLERRWADFDADAGTIEVLKTKTDRPRVLHLQQRTVRLFERLGGANPTPAGYIFVGRFPDQPIDFRKAWARLTRDIGRPELHLHDIRHAVAARLLRSGVSAAVAAQTLGHSVEVLDRRYGHLEHKDLRAALERTWSAAA